MDRRRVFNFAQPFRAAHAAILPLLLVSLLIGNMLGSGLAAAQTRTIPDDAKRGFIRHLQSMLVSIDDRQQALAPGAVIRDTNNLIIVPSALPSTGALAAYQVDQSGQVRRVWLLTPDEASRPPAKSIN